PLDSQPPARLAVTFPCLARNRGCARPLYSRWESLFPRCPRQSPTPARFPSHVTRAHSPVSAPARSCLRCAAAAWAYPCGVTCPQPVPRPRLLKPSPLFPSSPSSLKRPTGAASLTTQFRHVNLPPRPTAPLLL